MQHPLLPKTTIQAQLDGWEALRQKAELVLCNQSWPDAFQKVLNLAEREAIKNTPLSIKGKPQSSINDDRIPISETERSKLVFINGHFDVSRSNTENLPNGVKLLNLASSPNAARELGFLTNPDDEDLLVNLNTARFTDGPLLIVSKGNKIELPIRVSFINEQSDNKHVTVSMPRLLIIVESGASATLVEDYQGYGRYMTCSVTEVMINEEARLRHERIQHESPESLHFSKLAVRVERNGYYDCRTVSLGGHILWSTQNLEMYGQGADATLDGLTIIDSNQNSDTHSVIDHCSSNCTSKQTYRIIADDSSVALFDGIVHVHSATQGTDAQQQCRGLPLSTKAQIKIKPQLKIYTNDVKCNHGVAIGQLDHDMLFYLQSRGICTALARNMLTYAFASHLLTDTSIPSLRQHLYQLIVAITGTKYFETIK